MRRQRRQRAAFVHVAPRAPFQREIPHTTEVENPPVEPCDVTAQQTFFAEMSAKLDEGEARQTALSEVRGNVREFSLDPAGCRVVQKALSVAGRSEATLLVAELHGFVRVAISSPSGNYVIQKVVEVMPVNSVEFISAELADVALDMARHQYGCRVFCRLMEHHQGCAGLSGKLFDEVLSDTAALCCHCYGHHVIESVLEHGTCDQKHRIATALRGNLLGNATDRYATFVLRKALMFCHFAAQQEFVVALIGDVQQLSSLVETQTGFSVVKTVLRLPKECLRQALTLVKGQPVPDATPTRARRVLEELHEVDAGVCLRVRAQASRHCTTDPRFCSASQRGAVVHVVSR